MTKEATPGALGSNDQLGRTLDLLNRVLPCNPPWGPGQYVNVERLHLLLAAERERMAVVCEELETSTWLEYRKAPCQHLEGRSDAAAECAALIRAA